jgi:predicted acyl esterase
VIVTRRGMGRSGGKDAVYLNDTDVEDHAKVIQWAAAQPGCDGQVVLFGTSYYGLTQSQVARLPPPALKGFSEVPFDRADARQVPVDFTTADTKATGRMRGR